jgi:hypothetical protein
MLDETWAPQTLHPHQLANDFDGWLEVEEFYPCILSMSKAEKP